MRNCYEGDCYQISMGGFIAMLFFARFPAKVGLKWAHAHTHIYIYDIRNKYLRVRERLLNRF